MTFSYPVLGPDAFVVESLKEHVKRNQNRKRINKDVTVESLTKDVFQRLGFTPELAISRSRRQYIARGRRLVAWLWVECLGRPQVMAAEGLRVRGGAISTMLRRMRAERISKEDAALIDTVMNEKNLEV